ncbi:hypothetical protein [Sinorhizobium alkalisoli]|uniref:Uncharacterized protein n=1 Tax=Sinorhizobium alkalisoli TaxID=1752398 RepID=A0A1E3VHW6_9HYPH|nr:hypothetical protein [Sinorhizobium alkalisoli]MCG5478618.1 hypothetical protein [Sinorhizobium alkalisoli]ODR93182.1 hypothetical protein A8M32_01160 [Sinorhizobium alkalisoli]
MKTPWKFLARLTSRRPSAKAQGSSIGNDTDPKAHESEVDTSAHPTSLTVAARPPAHDENISADQGSVASVKANSDDDVAQALRPPIHTESAQHEADPSGAEANSLVPKRAASTKAQSKPLVKRRERSTRAKPHVAAHRAVAPKHHQSLQPLSSRDLFFQEVGTLEEEIKMLRTQLARKLHLQNVQLKKMLERFDVS